MCSVIEQTLAESARSTSGEEIAMGQWKLPVGQCDRMSAHGAVCWRECQWAAQYVRGNARGAERCGSAHGAWDMESARGAVDEESAHGARDVEGAHGAVDVESALFGAVEV